VLDILEHRIDAALVVSNDSDLKFPVQVAWDRGPVGIVNPSRNLPQASCAAHQLTAWATTGGTNSPGQIFQACQLPNLAAGVAKPAPW
jgi:hypothetical protein